MPSSSTKEAAKAKGEAILICLDNSWWMESFDSPMFHDQLSALEFYCKKKFKHPDTTVGVVGMAGLTATSVWIAPTRSLKRIITTIKDG
ncbi:dehydroascorbate reductase 2 [Tanacetum coccineum]